MLMCTVVPFGPFEQVGDVARGHILCGFAVDRDDDVARMNAGFVRGRSGEGINHDHFIVARPDRHTHAVVLAALVFAHERVGFRIEEIRVRIERVQHAGNRAVVDRLIGVHRFGVIVLNQRVNIGELLQAVLNLGVAGHGGLLAGTLGKQNAQETAG